MWLARTNTALSKQSEKKGNHNAKRTKCKCLWLIKDKIYKKKSDAAICWRLPWKFASGPACKADFSSVVAENSIEELKNLHTLKTTHCQEDHISRRPQARKFQSYDMTHLDRPVWKRKNIPVKNIIWDKQFVSSSKQVLEVKPNNYV